MPIDNIDSQKKMVNQVYDKVDKFKFTEGKFESISINSPYR